MPDAVAYAWYRLKATRRSESSYLLTVLLLVAALGGLSMGAIAAARSTESSYSDYAAASHVPQVFVLDGVINPAIGLNSAYNPALLHALAHLPHVVHVASEVELNMGPLTAGNHPEPNTSSISAEASIGGADFSEDPLTMTLGRMPDPHKADEFAMDAAAAKQLGYHLGQVVRMGWASNAQETSGDTPASFVVPADQRVAVKLVGIGGGQATTLFQDEDAANDSGTIMLFTPALTDKLLECCSNDMLSALTLRDGNRFLPAVEQEVKRVLPAGLPFIYIEAQQVMATADATLRPEAIALAVFGGIAGAAALLICGQVVGRRIRLKSDELAIVRALGADPSMMLWEGLLGTLGAVLVGCVGAVLIALALSPLAPLGPVRPYLAVAVHPDWTVLGLGAGALVVTLGTVAAVASLHARPGSWRRATRVPSSRVTSAATRAGLPPAAVAGVRFALEPGVGRSAVPVRSALLGAILAVTVVVATVTFGSSLNTLVSHPALYGWNWTYDIDGGGGLGDIPGTSAATLLDKDPYVAAWTGVYYSTLQLDGLDVPIMGTTPNAEIAPPLLSGHTLNSAHQVVLGAGTLRALHKVVGDTVVVRAHHGASTTLTIVGTATLPPIGVAGSSHLEMGTGAVLDFHLIPPADRDLFEVTPGPNAILVRTKGGASPQALRSLEAIGTKMDIEINGGSVLPVQRPAQIINYGSLGTTPVLLGCALAAGAACALAITLVTSVRRRRRDLAVLKTLGFTRGQLASAIAVQAAVAAVIGCAVGIPVGIAVGRVLWNLFAGEISAVPVPTVPAGTVAIVGFLAVALAVVVATVPGRLASRTRTSQLLRAE